MDVLECVAIYIAVLLTHREIVGIYKAKQDRIKEQRGREAGVEFFKEMDRLKKKSAA